jgi:hypothetical protein
VNEEQRISAEFAAQMLGLELGIGSADPRSMLAWVEAQPQVTPADIAAEWDRRGLSFHD